MVVKTTFFVIFYHISFLVIVFVFFAPTDIIIFLLGHQKVLAVVLPAGLRCDDNVTITTEHVTDDCLSIDDKQQGFLTG